MVELQPLARGRGVQIGHRLRLMRCSDENSF